MYALFLIYGISAVPNITELMRSRPTNFLIIG